MTFVTYTQTFATLEEALAAAGIGRDELNVPDNAVVTSIEQDTVMARITITKEGNQYWLEIKRKPKEAA